MSDETPSFTDMTGESVADAPEPVPCPFCGSGAAQLVVERWTAEDDPEPSHHVECLKCGSNGPQGDTAIAAAQAWNARKQRTRPVRRDTPKASPR